MPRLRRYDGYALSPWTIVLRDEPDAVGDDLVTHELCHVWQMQHRWAATAWAWLTRRYDENPFELEARAAVARTRRAAEPGG